MAGKRKRISNFFFTSHRGVTIQFNAKAGRGSLPPGCKKTPPVRPRRIRRRITIANHPPIHTISQHRLILILYIPTLFTISIRYFFTVLLLVIAWRKLERGSNKMFAPPLRVVFRSFIVVYLSRLFASTVLWKVLVSSPLSVISKVQ
jgi:hypothetical protein